MKFSEVQQSEWEELKPYLDTCLLPLTGLTGEESPWQVTEVLEQLRDLMDLVEIPFKGRVVTYPALQYKADDEKMIAAVNELCLKLKLDTFKYVILITVDEALANQEFLASDLFISVNDLSETSNENRAIIVSKVQSLWK
jgi:23S rRNA (pseudouridine1915-N3)-methyltransferase